MNGEEQKPTSEESKDSWLKKKVSRRDVLIGGAALGAGVAATAVALNTGPILDRLEKMAAGTEVPPLAKPGESQISNTFSHIGKRIGDFLKRNDVRDQLPNQPSAEEKIRIMNDLKKVDDKYNP